jgi:hypothetical protein
MAQRNCDEGIKMLNNLAAQYLKSARQKDKSLSSFDMKASIAPTVKMELLEKKELIIEEPPNLQKTNDKRLYSFHKETNSMGKNKHESQLSKKKRLTEV